MEYQENKSKLLKIWNRERLTNNNLSDYISLKEEIIKNKIINFTSNSFQKKISYFTTEFEAMDIINTGTISNNISGYYKSWEIILEDFPIRILPFIKISHIYTSDTNEKITSEIQLGNLAIEEYSYFTVKSSGVDNTEELKNESKRVQLITGFRLNTSEPTDLKMLQCKLIVAIYNPQVFLP